LRQEFIGRLDSLFAVFLGVQRLNRNYIDCARSGGRGEELPWTALVVYCAISTIALVAAFTSPKPLPDTLRARNSPSSSAVMMPVQLQ